VAGEVAQLPRRDVTRERNPTRGTSFFLRHVPAKKLGAIHAPPTLVVAPHRPCNLGAVSAALDNKVFEHERGEPVKRDSV
jgi:hypothetical protein